MQKYKVSVTKNQKRYTLVITAQNDIEAKERVHKEWYSILNIEKIDETDLLWSQFVFVCEKDGEVKSGKVVGEDIFKIFVKLKKELGYHIISLYHSSQEDISEEEKQKIIHELEQQYTFYIEKEQKNTSSKKRTTKKENVDGFYLKKELDETYKFIDFVLSKLLTLIEKPDTFISDDQRDILNRVYNSIIQFKKTTNIAKLKEIGELALLKIGEIELQELEKNKSEHIHKHLKETNKLLKEVGSNKQFIPKSHDIWYLLRSYVSDIKKSLKEIFQKKKQQMDTHSYEYVKNALVLKKYREKLIENTKNIYIHVFVFIFPYGKNLEKKDNILLERRVLKQNISLLQAKLKGWNFSYSRIVLLRLKLHNVFIACVQWILSYLSLVLFFYTFLFVFYFIASFYIPSLWENISFSSSSLLYIIIIMIAYMLLHLVRWMFSAVISLVLFSFTCIFLLVNF